MTAWSTLGLEFLAIINTAPLTLQQCQQGKHHRVPTSKETKKTEENKQTEK